MWLNTKFEAANEKISDKVMKLEVCVSSLIPYIPMCPVFCQGNFQHSRHARTYWSLLVHRLLHLFVSVLIGCFCWCICWYIILNHCVFVSYFFGMLNMLIHVVSCWDPVRTRSWCFKPSKAAASPWAVLLNGFATTKSWSCAQSCWAMLSHAEPRQAMSMLHVLHVLLMIWLADEAVGSQSRINFKKCNSKFSGFRSKTKIQDSQVARNGVLIIVQRQVFRAVGDQPMALEPGGPRFAIC